MKLTRTTRIELVGRGKLSLNPNQHIATGGEASVYRASGTVIKLYTDSNKLQQPGMQDNLQRLTTFSHPYIVAPQGLVLSDTGDPIGYYMPFVDDGEALSSLFTNDYRLRAGFGTTQASLLVDRMLKAMGFAHDHNAIMVDPNELNWTTVASNGAEREPRVLDVDSWIVGTYRPSTVPMMASIRDWHNSTIGHATDRFALGVVTFQVYTGIHPYKGTLEGYKRSELTRRMQNNASVFTPGIRLNQAVRDFSCIPGPLLGWYEAAFQQGERCAPPSPFDTGTGTVSRKVRVARIVTTATGSLKFEKLFEKRGDPITRVFPCGVVLTATGSLIDLETKRELDTHLSKACEVIQVGGGWVITSSDHTPSFTFVDGISFERSSLSFNLDGRHLVRYQNRLFLVTQRGLTELLLKRFARPILTAGQTWQTMVDSTRWFDGIGILDAMGATYLIAPFDNSSCAQIRVRELDGLHVVAAKSGMRFVSIITVDQQGEYRKLELTFDKLYTSYTTWRGDAESPELNMSLLPRGVAATVTQDGQLVIFVPVTGTINRVTDRDITTDMRLDCWGDRVVFIRDGQLWRVSMI